MELLISTCFFLYVREAVQSGISVSTKALESSYLEFVALLFSASASFCKADFRNILAYTRVEFDSFTVESERNVSVYLKKAVRLLTEQIEWLERQLLVEQQVCLSKEHPPPQTKLTWTAKKTELIEILYALHAAGCFNFGKISLSQIAAYFEEVFDTTLSNFPRDFSEMRIRNDKTPFMDRLKALLKMRMDNPKSILKVA